MKAWRKRYKIKQKFKDIHEKWLNELGKAIDVLEILCLDKYLPEDEEFYRDYLKMIELKLYGYEILMDKYIAKLYA